MFIGIDNRNIFYNICIIIDVVVIKYVFLKFTKMKERIKELIECKKIQPGELAIMLGIQRSNISHILNGRNKPGASLIEKILILFPELNARWLLTGEGNMFSSIDRVEQPVKKNVPEISIEKKQTESKKKIEKIILLHDDGSFLAFDK